ncbi:MAG: hypothetical protein M1268_02275 [Patescibacteria group bacterium]|nr:hypothetical protein [Patescibacteria group bacterium]
MVEADLIELSCQPERRVLIGRDDYAVVPVLSDQANAFLLESQERIALVKKHARALEFKFNNNSAEDLHNQFRGGRPKSAYFTLLDGRLIVEWGEISADGNAKLHDYLNRNLDYNRRVKSGGVLRSGHIGAIHFRKCPAEIRLALIDSLWSGQQIVESSPEYKITTTLLHNGILPITTDAIPAIPSE